MKQLIHGKVVLPLVCLILIGACRKEQSIVVAVDFDYTIIDSNFAVPVRILFNNKTSGAQYFKWTFEGGSPTEYNQKEPGTIVFRKAGDIKVVLEAWNDEMRQKKEVVIRLDSPLKAAFTPAIIINDFAPAEYRFTNASEAATIYDWQFGSHASISNSTSRDPGIVRFDSAGTYPIRLVVRNTRNRIDSVMKMVTVRPKLSADFSIEPSFDDDDYEAPLIATLKNRTISATIHRWSCAGGTINNAADSTPTIQFAQAGTYQVTYQADNGKQSQTITKTIVVKPNSRMRSFLNVRLGINTAHANIGSFFSTKLRRVVKEAEVDAQNGNLIDIVFFGLNSTFSFNKFISPDSAGNFTFAPIPNAGATSVVNKQEVCGCNSPEFSVFDFDGMTNGEALDRLTISAGAVGQLSFTDQPGQRVVLFLNRDGLKGAIKVKQFVSAGTQSYIICDIKVQKQ
jgi:PKD repeat protein